MFFSNSYFELADGISHVLVEIWKRSLPDVPLSHDFFFSFYHPKDEKHKENRYFSFKMLPFFFNFRNFSVSVVR